MNTKLFILTILTLSLSSCLKEEKKYPKITAAQGTITQEIGMGENYENQVYFDLETGKMASNDHKAWDIGFSSTDKNKIIINGGKTQELGLCNMGLVPFNKVYTASELNSITDWRFDHPNGWIDSNAFGPNIFTKVTPQYFEGNENLYILKLGDKSLGEKQYIRIKIINRNGINYRIKWAYLNDTDTKDIFIPTNPETNYTYYCFDCAKGILNEPLQNNEWDLLFTTYKQYVFEPSFNRWASYLLRGVISNEKETQVAKVQGLADYDNINLTFAKNTTFNDDLDNIGYDWKVFSLQANRYTIVKDNLFIIKNRNGQYFKMKFVDFYNALDQKGYPKIAYELLK